MAALTPVPFYFVRHGETDWNHRRIMQGTSDIELNAVGVSQAEEVAGVAENLGIATVCVSPLKRARRTAEILNRGNAPVVVIDDLKECSFGVYEGQSAAGAWREEWRAGASIPGGESFEDYVARALSGLNQALAHPGPVLVVAHGGTFWAIERHALKGERVRVANCVLFRLTPGASADAAWRYDMVSEPTSPHVAMGEKAPA